jgi:dynactin-4
MKIKMVAVNYLPVIELGRKRRKVTSGEALMGTAEEIERKRRERRRTRARGEEEDEDMGKALRPGEIVSVV